MDNHVLSNILLLLYTSVYVVFYIKLRKKRSFFGPTSLTLLVYAICGVCSIIVYNDNLLSSLYGGYGQLTLFPFVYLSIMVLANLQPTAKFEQYHELKIQRPSNQIIVVFLFVYAACSLALLPNTLARIEDGLQVLFYSNYGGQDLYTEGQLDLDRNVFKYNGIQSILSVICESFNEIAILLMFYYLTFSKKNKLLIVLLPIVFAADLLKPIASGQRTGIVMSILSIVLCYLLFRRYWNRRVQKTASRVLVIFLIVVSVPYVALTLSRFSGSQQGTTGSTLSYVGQANLNFNLYCLDAGGTRHGDRVTRGFKSVLGLETTAGTRDTRDKYSTTMIIDDSVFYTYVGDFTLDFGPFPAAIILLLFAIFVSLATRIDGHHIKFHQLLVLYFALAISLKGSFHLFPYSYSGNQVIIALFVMYLVFKIDSMSTSHHTFLAVSH